MYNNINIINNNTIIHSLYGIVSHTSNLS
jgi:hypothetical protein